MLLLAVLAALRAHYGLDPRRYNDYVLAEIAQRAEEHDLGVVCGYADRYVPLFGDLAYVSYHGKLWHAPLGEEPFATYEKLGAHVPAAALRRRHHRRASATRARCMRRCGRATSRSAGAAADRCSSWRGRWARPPGAARSRCSPATWTAFGRQIDRNQELVDEMMTALRLRRPAPATRCAPWSPPRAPPARCGAKLTGAGGGGAIFALPRPGEEDALADALRAAARSSAYRQRGIRRPGEPGGLRVQRR